MSDVVKIRLFVECCNTEDTLEVDRDEWEAMSEAEQREFALEAAVAHQENVATAGWELIEDEDD